MPAWRDSFKPARFFMLDARVAFLIIGTLLHFVWWTVSATVVTAVTLYYVEKRREMSVSSALRALRSWAARPVRPGRNHGKLRHPVDYERYD